MSGMKLCQGIVGRANRFAVIDAENKRASHYAPLVGDEPDFVTAFRFDVLDFEAPFTSERYEEMVKAAVKAGYKAIMLDSASHEHDGEGGYLDRQAQDLQERVDRYMKKFPNSKEWEVAEKLTPSSWTAPKKARSRMMQTLLACSTSIPIIFCFRAEEKVFSTKDGKLVANNPPIWSPICGKKMPFEMTAFFMVHASAPGVPVPIKVQAQHKALFPLDRPIGEESGAKIAEWAAGRKAPVTPITNASAPRITPAQAADIETLCKDSGIKTAALCAKAGVPTVDQILAANYQRAVDWVNAQIKARTEQAA